MAFGQRERLLKGPTNFQGDEDDFTGLFFRKTGSSIIEQAHKEIAEQEKEIGRIRRDGQELAKKHDLTIDEVISEERERRFRSHAGRVEDAMSIGETQYMSKATSNIAPTAASRNLLQQISADMAKLSMFAAEVFVCENKMRNLRRIVNHLDKSQTFTFDYDQLVELGFE